MNQYYIWRIPLSCANENEPLGPKNSTRYQSAMHEKKKMGWKSVEIDGVYQFYECERSLL